MKSLLLALLITVLLLVAAPNGGAQGFSTGSDFLERCQLAVGPVPDNLEQQAGYLEVSAWCGGLIEGVLSTEAFYTGLKGVDLPPELAPSCNFFEPPDTATYNQIYRVVIKYLEENPEEMHGPAGLLTIEALIEAFPCDYDAHFERGMDYLDEVIKKKRSRP